MQAAKLTAAAAAPTAKRWTIGDIVQWTQKYFAENNIETARLDAEVLLAHTLQRSRVYLYTHYDQPLQEAEAAQFGAYVRRRRAQEPVAYIVGKREFYGRDFDVSPAVLIPRPETEHIVEQALAFCQAQPQPTPWRIADVGTGSGILAITLALELPESSVVGLDVSAAALAQARHNSAAHGLSSSLQLLHSDLLEAVAAQTFDLVVSNPPYIKTTEVLPESVQRYEPAQALFAGSTGMQVIDRLCQQAAAVLRPGGRLIFEMGSTQESPARASVLATKFFEDISMVCDLAGLPRILCATKKGAVDSSLCHAVSSSS
jgi:release factor glutamine methyltransferase